MSDLVPPGTSIPDAVALFRQVVSDQQKSRVHASHSVPTWSFIEPSQVAALTVMLYDNLLTLPEFPSCGNRSGQKERYFSYLQDGLSSLKVSFILCSRRTILFLSGCDFETNLNAWSVLLFLIPLQVVIVMRTIALWNQSRLVFYFVTFSAVATDLALVGLLANVSKNELHFSHNPRIKPLLGCFADVTTFNPKSSTAGWSATMAFDFVIFTLTLVRSLRTSRHDQTPLLKVLIMDGFVYYCVMLTISILALTFSVALDERRETLFAMVPPIFKACYCILGSRITIRLRESYMQTIVRSTVNQTGDLEDAVELTTLNAVASPDTTLGSTTTGTSGTVSGNWIAEPSETSATPKKGRGRRRS